jgi:hypothetical protein
MNREVEQWRQCILSFVSATEYENPFLDVSVRAEFVAPSGRIIKREAYWDSGKDYKVSFAPTEVGIWNWRLTAPEETGLNGESGTVECVSYQGNLSIYKHGFLKVSPNGRYLMHDDGTAFFWLGDTHWEFASKEKWSESSHKEMDSMFKGMADRRAKQGYNVYQTNLRSDAVMGGDVLYWDKNSETDLPNVEFYQKELDRRMEYIANLGFVNALGLAWFVSMDGTEKSIAHQKNLSRYIVARYGALPICWTLAGEVAGYTLGEPRQMLIENWRKVALYIEGLDGYSNLQTAHYTNERPFADYYQEEEWFDFTLNQAGHGDFPISVGQYQEHRRKFPNKPFIEGEALYEYCSTLEELGTRLCTADMLRRVAYISIQTGGCGYTYGAQGIWDCVLEKGSKNPLGAVFNRFDITWDEAIDGIGGAQMGMMKQFYDDCHFQELHPYIEENEEAVGNPFGKKLPLISKTEDGKCFVFYYADTARSTCEISGMNDAVYHMQWFDPRTGTYIPADEECVPVNGKWKTPAKREAGDWLLVVKQ